MGYARINTPKLTVVLMQRGQQGIPGDLNGERRFGGVHKSPPDSIDDLSKNLAELSQLWT